MIAIRTGMAVRVRAVGPVIVPMPDGFTGPTPHIDFESSSGFIRIRVTQTNGFVMAVGTGSFSAAHMELAKPGGGSLRLRFSSAGQPLLSVGTGENVLPHFDLIRTDDQIVRLTASDDNQLLFALQ